MPVHHFGIMDKEPGALEYFVSYEPDKYACVDVDDDLLCEIRHQLKDLPTFLHSLNKADKGLAWFGITLISPSSVAQMLEIFDSYDNSGFNGLKDLLMTADRDNKWVIHFGI